MRAALSCGNGTLRSRLAALPTGLHNPTRAPLVAHVRAPLSRGASTAAHAAYDQRDSLAWDAKSTSSVDGAPLVTGTDAPAAQNAQSQLRSQANNLADAVADEGQILAQAVGLGGGVQVAVPSLRNDGSNFVVDGAAPVAREDAQKQLSRQADGVADAAAGEVDLMTQAAGLAGDVLVEVPSRRNDGTTFVVKGDAPVAVEYAQAQLAEQAGDVADAAGNEVRKAAQAVGVTLPAGPGAPAARDAQSQLRSQADDLTDAAASEAELLAQAAGLGGGARVAVPSRRRDGTSFVVDGAAPVAVEDAQVQLSRQLGDVTSAVTGQVELLAQAAGLSGGVSVAVPSRRNDGSSFVVDGAAPLAVEDAQSKLADQAYDAVDAVAGEVQKVAQAVGLVSPSAAPFESRPSSGAGASVRVPHQQPQQQQQQQQHRSGGEEGHGKEGHHEHQHKPKFGFVCPICQQTPFEFDAMPFRKEGLSCRRCARTFNADSKYIDLTLSSGIPQKFEQKAWGGTEIFRSPLVSFAYERGWRQGFAWAGFPGADKEYTMAMDYLRDAPEGVLVDMSCGSGLFTRRFAASGRFSGVVAADFSESMLQQTQAYLKEGGAKAGSPAPVTPVVLLRADVGRLPFATGSVSALHAGAALHCWPNPQAAMAEISRVLAPGGVFVASTFLVAGAPLGEIFGDEMVRPINAIDGGAVKAAYRWWEESELRELCTAVGLQGFRRDRSWRFIMFSVTKPMTPQE